MEPADLRAFADRDWEAIRQMKERYWIDRKRTMSPDAMLGVGDLLRRHAVTVRPGWPAEGDRTADLAVHCRVAEALGAVSRVRSR